MPIIDLYSKRKRRQEKASQPDVYQYDDLPQPFRVQVAHIWRDAIGPSILPDIFGVASNAPPNDFWNSIYRGICEEKGIFGLVQVPRDPGSDCVEYLLAADTDDALDIIELSFQVIDRDARLLSTYEQEQSRIRQGPDDAIEKLNQRFREHNVGYQYAGGIIIRVDSQYIHADAVRPALSLLTEPGFEGPEEEFLNAFDHFRHGREKEAVAEALKAFESTMKAICKLRGWNHDPNATAKPLLDLLFAKGLIPMDLQSHFNGLRSTLESGLLTVSNKTSRHGQGPEPKPIPPHYASYALHLAATNIVFLVQGHKSLP